MSVPRKVHNIQSVKIQPREREPGIPKMPQRFWDDSDWIEKNYTELVRKYPDQWIAVVNKKVVVAGKDRGKVREMARIKTNKEHVVTTFVENGNHVW